ncbi:MAG: trehalose-phosphatase [Thermoleophilaceae bacterium]|nr:trehalose-phosphatase [Thermoleophilaceae bacterium]
MLRAVSAHTSDTLAEALGAITADPSRAAVFCDVDGVLAPIVARAEEAQVRKESALLLGRLARRYACVACVSGRSAAEARRLVGVGGIVYAGSHGAELLQPGASQAETNPAFKSWEGRVKRFVADRDGPDLRRLRVRIEDKGPIAAFHWRGAPDEEAALARVEQIAREAEEGGLATHWGRKVLELRPPVPFDKGQVVRVLVERCGARVGLFGGDDTTDLDAFDALTALVEEGALDAAVRVGVRSDEGPPEIVERADVVVDGVEGFAQVLAVLAGP